MLANFPIPRFQTDMKLAGLLTEAVLSNQNREHTQVPQKMVVTFLKKLVIIRLVDFFSCYKRKPK